MGKKSSKTTSGPSKQALPFINSATSAVTDAYNANQPNIANISATLQNEMPGVINSTLNNPNLAAASGYNADVLSGKYLTGNPYLDKIVSDTNGDVTNTVNAGIGTRGGTGGSAQAQILARELAKNESSLRYTDYNNQQTRMDGAVGQATSLAGAQNSGIQTLLAYLAGSAEIPQSGANSYADAIKNLWGNSTTTTQTPSFLQSLTGLISAGAGAAKAASGAG